MTPQTRDTITALSSAPGPGGRAVVRLSGPAAAAAAASVFTGPEPLAPSRRCLLQGQVRLPGLAAPLPADLYFWPAPRTYTGQDMAELHTLSCPPLVDLLVAQLLRAGTRAAGPGEFTLRAFLAGKPGLTPAEAVAGGDGARARAGVHKALGG